MFAFNKNFVSYTCQDLPYLSENLVNPGCVAGNELKCQFPESMTEGGDVYSFLPTVV